MRHVPVENKEKTDLRVSFLIGPPNRAATRLNIGKNIGGVIGASNPVSEVGGRTR